MSAKISILSRLRAALPAGTADSALPAVAEHYATVHALPSRPERIAQLRGLLEAAHAEVIVARNADWPALLAARLAELGVARLAVAGGDPEIERLSAATAGRPALVPFDKPIDAWKQEFFDTVDAGFTVADSAIAATGTLVFRSAPGKPRSLSLVPPLHVALVKSETIHAHLYAAALEEGWAESLPTNLIMVSGPSKTSDIQQTLAYGAHGPKQMLVVIVDNGVGA